MIEKVEGVVISEKDYSESSKIINIITKEHGVIGVMAKGAKKMKSELRSVTTKLTYGYFHIYYKKDKLSTLISVDVINNFKSIKTDLQKIGYVSFISELTEQVLKQNFDNNIYPIYIGALLKINEGFDSAIITNIVELKYLDYLGIMPIIDECAICGNKTNIITISSNRGGYLCKNCVQGEVIVDDKVVKLIRMFYYVDISKISNLNIEDKIKNGVDSFLTEYYERYTGLYLKSKKFLQKINS